MVLLRRLCSIRPSAILKSPKAYRLIATLIILFVMCCFAIAYLHSCLEMEKIDMIYAMYEELKGVPDFDALLYKDGTLLAVDYEDNIQMPLAGLTNCIDAMSNGRVKSVMKIGNDIFFTMKGFVDNYSGFVLSEDTLIEMHTLNSLNREIRYEYGLFCFSFCSMN